jgi:hypothetical protein
MSSTPGLLALVLHFLGDPLVPEAAVGDGERHRAIDQAHVDVLGKQLHLGIVLGLAAGLFHRDAGRRKDSSHLRGWLPLGAAAAFGEADGHQQGNLATASLNSARTATHSHTVHGVPLSSALANPSMCVNSKCVTVRIPEYTTRVISVSTPSCKHLTTVVSMSHSRFPPSLISVIV